MQNNKFLCPHCNKEIEEDKRDLHNNYCLYTPKNEEFYDLIPCEFCDEYINFDDYQEHISHCRTLSLRPSLNYSINYNYNTPSTINTLSNLFSTFSNLNTNTLSTINEEENETENTNANLETGDLNYYFPNTTITSGLLDNIHTNESNQTNTLGIFDYLYNNENLNSNISLSNENNNLNISLNNINNILETLGSNTFNFSFNLEDEDEYLNLTNLSNEIGNVEIGIKDIDTISSLIKKKELCPICKDEHETVRKTVCNHYFCNNCLQIWLKNNKTCPVCLKDFSEKVL